MYVLNFKLIKIVYMNSPAYYLNFYNCLTFPYECSFVLNRDTLVL